MNGPEFDARFERLEALVRAESAETRAMVAETRTLLDERTAGINARIDRGAAETRELVDLRASETRAHLDAVAERLDGKVQKIADRCGALRDDVEGLKASQARLESGLARLDLRMMALKRHRAG